MGGGALLQMTYSSSSQDMIFTGSGNPQMTYFKNIYRTHSRFAIDDLTLNCNRTTANFMAPTELRCKIERNGDLVSSMYFTFELPSIYCDGVTAPNFRWIPNVAEAILDSYYLVIGGSVVDKQYGEFTHLWHHLSMSSDKRELYDQLTGNVQEVYDPDSNTFYTAIKPLVIKKFPYASGYDVPTIRGRRVYVPLSMWFCRDPSLALPLVALQYSPVEVVFVLRPLMQLYQLYYTKNGVTDWYAPLAKEPSHHLKNYLNPADSLVISDTVIDMKVALETTYVVLDTDERTYFALKPIDYLMTQLTRVDTDGIIENNSVTIPLMNATTELIWVLKRSDQYLKNEWFTFTDSRGRGVMKTGQLLFNGYARTPEKDAAFFELLQPFKHHNRYKPGVYCYSFSLNPQDVSQPSGHANMSRVTKFQLYLTLASLPPEDVTYTLSIYALSMNFLRTGSGLARLMYAS